MSKENENEVFEAELEATKQEILFPDLLDDSSLGEIIPTMNVPALHEPPVEKCIVSDDAILDVYDEILNEGRQDRKQMQDLIDSFAEMVLNEGDATSSTKEGLVNLVKARSDVLDKMAKVADLMTRMKLKDKDTFPRYLAATQHNNVTIESNNTKRDILKSIQAAQKKKEKK